MANPRRPLAGIVIVDAVAGPLAPATRYLAELGANVVRIEAPKTDGSTREQLKDAAANNGKTLQEIDYAHARDREKLSRLIETADALIIDAHHPFSGQPVFSAADLFHRYPQKLIVACSDFGQGNRCSEWQATDAVLHALTGELSRSGIAGQAPLLPPGELAVQCSAVQLAYVILTGLIQRAQTGTGDLID
jgi:crotonobetainyl-CoA:carnitine CoA-transferase CaiB-like acyl-CoA transferase